MLAILLVHGQCRLRIVLKNKYTGLHCISILNGHEHFNQAITVSNAKLNTESLDNGIYMLKVVTKSKTYTQKVIITK